MKDFALDAQGDILIEAGKIVLVHGKEQEIQKNPAGTGDKVWGKGRSRKRGD